MGKMSVAQILVTRDRISIEDALARVDECSNRLYKEAVSAGDYELAEGIIADSAIKSYIRETNMVGAKISCQIIG